MALGMAAMFVPAVDPLPVSVWAGLFLVLGAWFGAESIREGSLLSEPGHHVVGAAAMLFMLTTHGGHREAAGSAAALDPAHAHHATAAAQSSTDLLGTAMALALIAWLLADITRRVAPVGMIVAPGGELLRRNDAVSARRESNGSTVPPLVMSGAMTVMLLGMA